MLLRPVALPPSCCLHAVRCAARGLVERLASGGPFSPDYGDLVDVLVEGGSGFRALLKLVHKRLQVRLSWLCRCKPGRGRARG